MTDTFDFDGFMTTLGMTGMSPGAYGDAYAFRIGDGHSSSDYGYGDGEGYGIDEYGEGFGNGDGCTRG